MQVSDKISVAHRVQRGGKKKVPNARPHRLKTAPAACAATFRTIGAAFPSATQEPQRRRIFESSLAR
jgi:hypothetical protein